jgi:hypothetical protein
MKWTIHNTLVCPYSGVAFSSISSLRFLKFILWYEADILLLPGESMKLYSSSVLINEQYHAVKVYNITRYDEAQWEKLRERPSCPYQSTHDGKRLFLPGALRNKTLPEQLSTRAIGQSSVGQRKRYNQTIMVSSLRCISVMGLGCRRGEIAGGGAAHLSGQPVHRRLVVRSATSAPG